MNGPLPTKIKVSPEMAYHSGIPVQPTTCNGTKVPAQTVVSLPASISGTLELIQTLSNPEVSPTAAE